MSSRLRVSLWSLLVLIAVVGAGVLARGRALQRTPDLDRICALARARQYDQAQALMAQFLRAFPDHSRANLLMAEFALDRPDPQPERALDHLRRVQAGTPREAASVRFCEGKANYFRRRYDLAEARWIEALQIDPTVPEAAWALLDLLDLEARTEDAHQLGMWIHRTEPDARERVRALLELSRIDVDRVAPESLVPIIQPQYLEHPEALSLALVAGRSLIHVSRFDEGLEALREALRRHPGSARAWDAWLTGLVEAFRPEEFVREFARLPRPLAADPRFAKHEGNVAQSRRDWPAALRAYRRAHEFEPFNGGVLDPLRTVLRVAGEDDEADRMDREFLAHQAAFRQMREVYAEALAVPTLGLAPHPDLYHRLADLREQFGRLDEALAWHRLVLRDAPDDAVSLAALERLKYHQQAAGKQPTPSLSDIFRN